MPERELKKRTSTQTREAPPEEETVVKGERGEKLKADIDDILDEIDEVLEDNAEEFVRNYVQKGGE